MLCWSGLLPWEYLYEHSASMFLSSLLIGVIGSAYLVGLGSRRSTSLLKDYFLGTLENPRLMVHGRVLDAKMYLYLVGAVHLELNLLSYTAAHWVYMAPDANIGITLSFSLLSWFVFEYLCWENVHLYTYDFFAERVGFKLGFGCLCFYPFVYALPMWSTTELSNPHQSMAYYFLSAALYFAGWALSRGANLQKYWFKTGTQPPVILRHPRLGIWPVQTVRSMDGQQELLCGGLWGVSRHVNYLGETLEAIGIVLALGHPSTTWLPWLYPLYYVGLFVSRERDDEWRCRQKYGRLWDEYCQRVPYRIIPYIY